MGHSVSFWWFIYKGISTLFLENERKLKTEIIWIAVWKILLGKKDKREKEVNKSEKEKERLMKENNNM